MSRIMDKLDDKKKRLARWQIITIVTYLTFHDERYESFQCYKKKILYMTRQESEAEGFQRLK